MSTPIHIPVILGPARAERQSELVARAVVELMRAHSELTTELVDVRDHLTAAATLPPWGPAGTETTPTAWQSIVQKADALLLVTPEYNRGYPGELKLLLDTLYEEYTDKPIGLVGVSSGMFGGARVVDHIKPVLIELGLHPVRPAAHVMKVADAFAEDGTFKNEKTAAGIEKTIAALVAFTKKLQRY